MISSISNKPTKEHSIAIVERKFYLANSRLNSIADAFKGIDVSQDGLTEKLKSSNAFNENSQVNLSESTLRVDDAEAKSGGVNGNLRELLDHLNAEEIMGMSLNDINKDIRLNPKNRKLNRIETAEAMLELSKVEGMRKILDNKIILEVAKDMEILRSSRSFVEYINGEQYATIEGVMTSAEPTRDGIRMFYIYPEKFPEVYDFKEQRKQIIEEGLYKLLELFRKDED